MSSVHISDEISKSPEITDAIKWSRSLDQVFWDNKKADPSIFGQFFGSSTGFMRHFPVMGKEKPEIDPRHRDWYTLSATGPKDVVIILDTSLLGRKQMLAKQVANTILDTLTENDDVAIVGLDARPLLNCSEYGELETVQATHKNVALLRRSLNASNTPGTRNETAALIKSFELLEWRRIKLDSGVQAMMVISDQLSPNEYIFWNYNMPHKPNRVFTFLIGQNVTEKDKQTFKSIACENKGWFSHIRTMSEAKEKTLAYMQVSARPQVLVGKSGNSLARKSGKIRYTGVYLGGPKKDVPMISAAVPVFDRRNFSRSDKGKGLERVANLLGVAGIDITIEEITKLVPTYKTGVNAYVFVINNNGHVIFHPDYDQIARSEANLQLDLLDIEIAANKTEQAKLVEMRKKMTQCQDGQSRLIVQRKTKSSRRGGFFETDFYFYPLSKAEKEWWRRGKKFSLGLALPVYGHNKLTWQNSNLGNLIDDLLNDEEDWKIHSLKSWTLHPEWSYCTDMIHDRYPQEYVKNLLKSMKNGTQSYSMENCDLELMTGVLFDLKLTKEIKSIFNVLRNSTSPERVATKIIFVTTPSGITRWVETGTGFVRDIVMKNDKAIDEYWYKGAVQQSVEEPESFFFTISPELPDIVTVATAILKTVTNTKTAPAAVVGAHINYDELAKIMTRFSVNWIREVEDELNCANDSIACYFLDTDGYVVFAKEKSNVGKFIGQVDNLIEEAFNQEFPAKEVIEEHRDCSKDSRCDRIKRLFEFPSFSSWTLTQGFLSDKREFHVLPIPHTNLAVYISTPGVHSIPSVQEITESMNADLDYCLGLQKTYPRSHLHGRIWYHREEEEIPACTED